MVFNDGSAGSRRNIPASTPPEIVHSGFVDPFTGHLENAGINAAVLVVGRRVEAVPFESLVFGRCLQHRFFFLVQLLSRSRYLGSLVGGQPRVRQLRERRGKKARHVDSLATTLLRLRERA